MKVLLSWLRELTDLPSHIDEHAVAHRLTMSGLEVEGLERLDEGLDKVVVGEVRSKTPIEGTRLNVCQVFDGESERQIVCGAQNYEVGDHVPAALPGAVLPGNKAIGAAKLRGVDSFGMLCSGKELNADDGVDGLLILPRDTVPGTPIARVLGREDLVLELNVTPNRADALSHLGVAREVAALFALPHVTGPVPIVTAGEGAAPVTVSVEDPSLCTHYAGRVLEAVRVGPSPAWLRQRLEALGQRSINNVVDATNFVMFELGQPLHAFDLDAVEGGRIVVRRARAGETLKTLDGRDRTLSTEDLCICDAHKPVALAGVMGGENSEVSDKTTRLFLESAFFAPSTVRKSARRHQIHSDASHRFERGVDPERVRLVLDRLTELLVQIADARVVGDVVETVARPFERARITLRHARLESLLGSKVDWAQALEILRRLGLEIETASKTEAVVRAPGARLDLTREEDLIEEVARVRGLETIEPKLPSSRGSDAVEPLRAVLDRRLRQGLSAAGIDEAVNLAFTDPTKLAVVNPSPAPLSLRNPIASDLAVLRTTLLAGLLRNVSHNLRHGADSVRLYELGRVYLPLTTPSPVPQGDAAFLVDEEPVRLALVLTGRRARGWTSSKQPLDFYDLKGAVESALQALGVSGAVVEPARAAHLHPRATGALRLGGQAVGHLGELHPLVAQAFDLPAGVFVAELEAKALFDAATPLPWYKGVPRFPASLRDVALVVDDTVTAAAFTAELRQADEKGLIESVELFDVYKGESLPAGKKSLAFSLRYRSPDRTLTDDEVNAAHAQVVGRLESVFGARLRS